jgi:hypothetical protein
LVFGPRQTQGPSTSLGMTGFFRVLELAFDLSCGVGRLPN